LRERGLLVPGALQRPKGAEQPSIPDGGDKRCLV
jgi:hypothetical protein